MYPEPAIVLRPVGVVRSPIVQPADDCWGDVLATIELDGTQFPRDCTLGLEEYSHVEVVFYLHRIPAETIVSGARHPRGRADWPRWVFSRSARKTAPTASASPPAGWKASTA